MKKILVVDDEPSIVTLLKYNLEAEHYEVDVATDGAAALEMGLVQEYDFILLDLMLPKLDGLEVTKQLRKHDIDTPIVILTAKDSETDKIIGLELGADDYVTKPFSPREIIARLKAIERRIGRGPGQALTNSLHIGELEIDVDAHRALLRGKRLQLTPKEFELLLYFGRHLGQTISRDRLLDRVWGFDYPGETRMVDIQISHLRDKIEDDTKQPKYLKTVRGFGYQLEEPADV